MKVKIIAALLGLAFAAAAWAACSTSTVTYGGRTVTCTTCCYGGNCNTTCW